MTSIFNTRWEHCWVHVWCKCGDSSQNLWRVIAQTKVKMTLAVRVNDPQFQYQPRKSQNACLVQICDGLSCGQAEFPKTLSQNGQNDLEGQGQWHPFSIPGESLTGCMFGANLVILAQICDELSHGQAEFPRILSQNGQDYLEDQCQWPPFSIPAESIPGRMFGAYMVIPA